MIRGKQGVDNTDEVSSYPNTSEIERNPDLDTIQIKEADLGNEIILNVVNLDAGDDGAILPHPEQILSLDAYPKETLDQEWQNISMTEEAVAHAMTAFDLTKEEILSLHAAFKAYDRDGDGAITINDLHKVFGESIQDDILKEWIKKNDSGIGEKVVFNDFLIQRKESSGLSGDEMLALSTYLLYSLDIYFSFLYFLGMKKFAVHFVH